MKLMSLPFSCFFCQQLFFCLDKEDRTEIIKMCFSSMDELLNSNHSILSFVFIFENTLTQEEQCLIASLMINQISRHITNKRYLRLLESIVSCFDHENILKILQFIARSIHKIIDKKQGYFLVRALIRSSKYERIQNEIIKTVSSDFLFVATELSGSLIIQCIIHNFGNPSYTYSKCCSNYLTKSKGMKGTITHEYSKDSISLVPLKRLYQCIFESISSWDHDSIKPIVTCAIKVNHSLFNWYFCDLLSSQEFLQNFNCLESKIQIISVMKDSYSPMAKSRLYRSLSDNLLYFAYNKKMFEPLNYFSKLINFPTNQLNMIVSTAFDNTSDARFNPSLCNYSYDMTMYSPLNPYSQLICNGKAHK